MLHIDVQRILVLDAPAVLGPDRFTELDERYAFAVINAALRSAVKTGSLRVEDPETVTRLLLGALTRGAMLIASSPDPVHIALNARIAERTSATGVNPNPSHTHRGRLLRYAGLRTGVSRAARVRHGGCGCW